MAVVHREVIIFVLNVFQEKYLLSTEEQWKYVNLHIACKCFVK